MNIFHKGKWVSKKSPNSFRLFGRPSTKPFSTSTSDGLSTISLWVFKTANELSRFCVIVHRSQVFILHAIENERLAVADVEPFVNTSRIIVITLQTRGLCCCVDCKSLKISSKLQGEFSSEMKSSSHEMNNQLKSPNYLSEIRLNSSP